MQHRLGERGEHLRRDRGRPGVRGGGASSEASTAEPHPHTLRAVEALVAFAATLVAVRLAAELARRWRARRTPELAAWAASLAAYAAAAGATGLGRRRRVGARRRSASTTSAAACSRRRCSVPARSCSPVFGLRHRWRSSTRASPIGVAIVVPVDGGLRPSSGIRKAQQHLDFFPARLLAILGNVAGDRRGRGGRAPQHPPAAARERPHPRRRGQRRQSGSAARRPRRGRDGRLRRRGGRPAVRRLRGRTAYATFVPACYPPAVLKTTRRPAGHCGSSPHRPA